MARSPRPSFIETAIDPEGSLPEDIVQGLGTDIDLVPDDPEVGIEENEDGGVTVDFAPEDSSPEEEEEFDDNLAGYIEENELDSIGRKICEMVEIDDRSRDDWKRSYIKGLSLLGFKTEERTDPWSGACGVFHPVMTEAAVRFQSQAIMEIYPAGGPVRTKTLGKWTKDKEKQAKRVEQELNYFLLDRMTEFRPETEQLLFYLALAGSAFRKIYYSPELKRPVGRFIPAEDFIVPYGTTDLRTCPRYTQVMRIFPNDLKKMQVTGQYSGVDLPKPTYQQDDIKEKYDKLTGRSHPSQDDERYTLYECHVDWDLPGFEDTIQGDDTLEESQTGIELPYVITVDKSSQKVLAIRRNWSESDPMKIRRQHFTPYHYLPGLGFYGSGLIHLIGGITASATSILRQLVDAGTLANLPGGLKSRGMRIKGDDSPIMPGEFRDVDVPSGNIRDNIAFLPYKEPSAVLHSLLNDMIQEGRRLGAAPDLPINAMTQQAPVGTTLALLERSMKVMSAVQARLHASLKQDLKLIADIIATDMGPEYEYEVEQADSSRVEDFAQVDIIPVSDPNAASMAQRVVQGQAILQLAQTDQQAFDMPLLYRDFVTVLGAQNADKIVKDPEDIAPMDPVSENMALLMGKPVKAFLYQDQEAHIQVHLAAAQDPKIMELVGQSPQASRIQAALAAHVSEHLAYAYRKGIEEQMGVPLPPEDQPLPEDVEVMLSKTVAEASKRLLQKDQAEAAQKKNQQAQQDPVVQMQQQELQIKQMQAQQKAEAAKQELQFKMAALAQKEAADQRRLTSQERVAGAALGVKIAQSKNSEDATKRQNMLDTGLELLDLEMRAQQLKSQDTKKRSSNGSNQNH